MQDVRWRTHVSENEHHFKKIYLICSLLAAGTVFVALR